VPRRRACHSTTGYNRDPAIAKLDKYHLLILDDLAYVTKDQAETSVLFELISARYERRSLLITANQPFGDWGKVFPDPAMTVAVVDRLVHHATIFEMNVESYRRRAALERKRSRRPPVRATIKADAFSSRSPRYSQYLVGRHAAVHQPNPACLAVLLFDAVEKPAQRRLVSSSERIRTCTGSVRQQTTPTWSTNQRS
jgi:hypothetical protein